MQILSRLGLYQARSVQVRRCSGLYILSTCLLLLFYVSESQAERITLHTVALEEHSEQHQFFHELLTQSLTAAGYTPELIIHKLPHLRANMHLKTGDISVMWLVESKARNEMFLPIETGLTNGLIGQRLMLIRKNNQYRFDGIDSHNDIRMKGLHTALGRQWFDVDVWRANDLPYVLVDGNWKRMFTLLKKGRVDYLSRSVIEIRQEQKEHPELVVEKNLMLVYDRDYRFYLSRSGPVNGAQYYHQLQDALRQAKASGLIDTLVKKYWSDDFRQLDYFQRRHLILNTPD